MDVNEIEMEVVLPVPGVQYAMVRLRAAFPAPYGKEGSRNLAWDALCAELLTQAKRQANRISDDLARPKEAEP